MKKKSLPKLLFPLIILVISIFFRFYQLGSIPQAFHFDEAGLGYNAWSIMETGKDEWGKSYPLTLQSFGDYKPAVYSYLVIPFMAIMGVTETAVRMPAIVLGSLLPLLLYFLIKKLINKDDLAFWSALVVAISPWHIEVSRTAIEAGVAVFMLLLTLLLFSKNKKWADLTGLLIALVSLFTYHTARLVIPALLLVGILLKVIRKSKIKIWGVIFLLVLGLGLSITASESRFDQISIFNDREAKLLREEAIREDGTMMDNILVTRVFHNKYASIVWSFSKSFIQNTSLEYLFIGGAQPLRTAIPETGQFQLILLPFFLMGLAFMARSFGKMDKFVFMWILVAAIPASLTYAEIPHSYRTLFMLPPISLIIASGVLFSWKLIQQHTKRFAVFVGVIFVLLLGLNTIKSWHQYIIHQQTNKPWYRQFGYKDLVNYINDDLGDAEKITFTNLEGEPYIFMLFYNQIHPSIYQASTEKRLMQKQIDDGETRWTFMNYEFVNEHCPYDTSDTNPNNYYITYKFCIAPEGYERVHSINYMDGSAEFHIDHPKVD